MLSVFPKGDREQTLRIKRFLMAFGAYVIWSAICYVGYGLGLTTVSLIILSSGVAASFCVNIILYVIFRTGLNKKFKDPSLTLLQMVIATFWIMVVVYYAYEARSAILLVYMVVLVFGFFRLGVRQFLFLSTYAVLNYSAVIFLTFKIHPETINKGVDIFNIIVLAFILPWFSMVGGYITRLRTKVSNALTTVERVTNNIQDVIFVLDMNLNYTYISPSVKILRGYEPEEVLKQALSDTFAPSSLDLAMKTLFEFIEAGKSPHEVLTSKTLELEIRRKDGSTLWTETKLSIIKERNQQTVRILGVMRDISERKDAEKLLKQSEAKYRLVANNVTDVIFTTDMNLQYTYLSPSIKHLDGYTVDEVMKMKLTDIVSPETLSLMMKIFDEELTIEKKDDLDLKRSRVLEYQHKCKDGSKIWVETKFTFLRDENNKAIGILGIMRDITTRKESEMALADSFERMRKSLGVTINVLVTALEMRDPYTAGHQSRVADLACAIAKEMGLPQNTIEGIRMAGVIHDIGKLSIPAEILTKPTKLTNLEFTLIKEHARSGYEMLKDVESPWPLAEIVHQHHERMDGSGYPRKLKGDEILLEARIMAVADVVEAMASHRPYRPSLGIKAALDEIEKNKGILYDDVVSDTCLKLFREKGYNLE
ncbi:MAG: PAS domain S-box protein [Syntrophaceae bacterium]|nr:PAS domain S-box protein [Syntrophaceae bacterium]